MTANVIASSRDSIRITISIRKTRSSRSEVFCKRGVLRNFAKFTRKHLCQSLFLMRPTEACNFIKKETLAQVISHEFCKISKSICFTEHFPWLLLKHQYIITISIFSIISRIPIENRVVMKVFNYILIAVFMVIVVI